MGNIDSCCLLMFSPPCCLEGSVKHFNEFYFVNTYCVDKNLDDMVEIAKNNGYRVKIINYINRYLINQEVYNPKIINFYTYKYDEKVVQYATIGSSAGVPCALPRNLRPRYA